MPCHHAIISVSHGAALHMVKRIVFRVLTVIHCKRITTEGALELGTINPDGDSFSLREVHTIVYTQCAVLIGLLLF